MNIIKNNFIPRYSNIYPSPIILTVKCKYCGAKVGDVCSTRETGVWARVIHKSRIDDYEEKLNHYETNKMIENSSEQINSITQYIAKNTKNLIKKLCTKYCK